MMDKSRLSIIALAAALLAGGAGQALAAGPVPAAAAAPAGTQENTAQAGATQESDFFAPSPNPWQIRLRALGVLTRNNGKVYDFRGSDLGVTDTVIPEFDISYFFTNNISAELILGTTNANIYAKGSITSLGKVARTWILPPTLTLQYHFTDFGAFRPYVGAGVTYMIFYSEDGKGVADKIDLDNTWGPALQIGFDYMIDSHWGLNFDAKKIWVEPDYKLTVGGEKLHGKANLDPWLIGGGIVYRF